MALPGKSKDHNKAVVFTPFDIINVDRSALSTGNKQEIAA